MKNQLSLCVLCIGLKFFRATQVAHLESEFLMANAFSKFQIGEETDKQEVQKGWKRIRESLSRGKSKKIRATIVYCLICQFRRILVCEPCVSP